VQHDEASVRRASFSTLARWSTDPSITPTLLQGLTDSDQSVRKSTAYGLIGYAHADASVVAALFQTAEDFNEHHRTRRGAVQALKGMDLDESMQERLKIAEASIN